MLVITLNDTIELTVLAMYEQVLDTTEMLVFTMSDTIELTVLAVSKCWTPLRCWHSQ